MTTIEVTTIDAAGERVDTAEAETPEDAIFAGQTLYDEGTAILAVEFHVDGQLVQRVHGRPAVARFTT